MKTYIKSYNLFVFLLLLTTGFTIYSNSFEAGLHLDDGYWIVQENFIKNIHNVIDSFRKIPTRFVANLTFAINYSFARQEVYSYHLLNLLIHIAASYLVYLFAYHTLFLSRLDISNKHDKNFRLISIFASLIFLTHPVQTESVTYIIQRITSLAALFYIASVVFYIHFRIYQNRFFYFCTVISVILAMMTKEITVTAPLIILIYELTFFDRESRRENKIWFYLFPLLLTVFIIPALRIFSLLDANIDLTYLASETTELSRKDYFLTQLNVIKNYLGLILIPINQRFEHDFPISHSIFNAETFTSLLILSFIIYYTIKHYKNKPIIAFGIIWFFITLSVESSIIPISDVFFEHRLYLPMAGVALSISFLLFQIINNKKISLIVGASIIILLSILTYNRNFAWSTEITLLEDSLKKSPNARALQNLANAYIANGKADNAIILLNQALELSKKNNRAKKGVPIFLFNLGRAYSVLGEFDKGIEMLIQAVDIVPGFTQAWTLLGWLFQQKEDYKMAIDCYEMSEELNPDNPSLYEFKTSYYLKLGDKERAMENYIKLMKSYKIDQNSIKNIVEETKKNWELKISAPNF